MPLLDAVVVGAGPAGLTAATYLARFRRRVAVVNAGPPRASWIPESHNTPGFPHPISGQEMLRRMTAQATQYGAVLMQGRVDSLAMSDGVFSLSGPDLGLTARTVLLATGVVDVKPDIPGLEDAILRSLVRMCPICDAFEAIGKRLAVLGNGGLAQREAEFLRTYSDLVEVVEDPAALSFTDTEVVRGERRFDHLYLALGCDPQASLATDCGAQSDETGNLLVNAHQMTTVDGLYAAGDVVRGLSQIAVATGEAAIAATDIHNRLRRMAD